MKACGGCGRPINTEPDAERPDHGGITYVDGGIPLTVWCKRTAHWQRLREVEDTVSAVLGSAAVDARRRWMAAMEYQAYQATVRVLRPRLRWAANRPRALRLLKRLRLYTPPTVSFYTTGDTLAAYVGKDGMIPVGMSFHRTTPKRMSWNPTELRFEE